MKCICANERFLNDKNTNSNIYVTKWLLYATVKFHAPQIQCWFIRFIIDTNSLYLAHLNKKSDSNKQISYNSDAKMFPFNQR